MEKITPKEKLDTLYNKIRIKVDKSNPLEDIHKTTKKLCDLYVTEILTSALISLTDEQLEFWLQVNKEIGNL